MKAIALILMAFLLAAVPVHAASDVPPITIDLTDVPLAEALDQIQQTSGIRIAYSPELIANTKPVTLKTDNEPVDEVLHRILRPNGLEFIYTGENVAAIVRADSDMGMAKMVGRALRTFFQLEEKLEAAEQHGDEVRVPGWTDADDRALAEAYIDLMSAQLYFAKTVDHSAFGASPWLDETGRAMKAYDRDVRAGGGLPLAVGAQYGGGLTREDVERFKNVAMAMMKDTDPVVRDCWLFALVIIKSFVRDEWVPLITSAVAEAEKDFAPEVRSATALLHAFIRRGKSMHSAAEELAKGNNAEARILRALQSDDEIDRIVGLLACSVRWRRQEEALSPELCNAVRAAFSSPTFAESATAVQFMGRTLPFDDLMTIFQEEAMLKPESMSTRLLLMAVWARRVDVPDVNEETRAQRQLMLWDALHESKSSSLQILFLKRAAWSILNNQPLLLCVIYDSEPQAFCTLLSEKTFMGPLRSEELGRAILHRVGLMRGSADPALRVMAVKVTAAFARGDPYRLDAPEIKGDLMSRAGPMLGACFREGAADEETAAGFQLLEGLLGSRGPMALGKLEWSGIPHSGQEAVIRALGYANGKMHGAQAAELLSALFQHDKRAELANSPELQRAMVHARRKIMEAGRTHDQIVVLCGVAMTGEEALARPAVIELEQRLVEGAVPANLQKKVLISLQRRPPLISLGFREYLMKRLSDPEEPAELRLEALGVLGRCPDQMAPVIDALREVAKAEQPAFTFASQFRHLVDNEMQRLKKEGEAAPPWARDAADLGLMLANDPKQTMGQRQGGLELYAAAAGEEGSETIEAFVRDEKADVELRMTAAVQLEHTSPETRLYGALAPEYDTLDRLVRAGLLWSASQSPKAPGAEAFIIKYLKGEEAKVVGASLTILWSMRLPLTPKLKAALLALENDPRVGPEIPGIIQRLERNQ